MIKIGDNDDNILTGSDEADSLNGLGGADTLTGMAGDDTYYVDDRGDRVVEAAGQGIDTVMSSVTWTLGANVEYLYLTGKASIDGTGNRLDNFLGGNAGANVLDGGYGADIMRGGAGDDTYVVDNVHDRVLEDIDGGTDTVLAQMSYRIGNKLENLTLLGNGNYTATGNAGDNILTGNAGNNLLDGLAGADDMIGGIGSDTYMVDNTDDLVIEYGDTGTDVVYASADYALTANVEKLYLTGSAITGTGNSGFNTLTGNDLGNVLSGLGGRDTLYGGAGADTLDGGDSHDWLDGGAGADSMIGGAGNDTFVVDDAGDLVSELPGSAGGSDLVLSSVSYSLVDNVGNLTLTGIGAINATGNTLANTLIGNAGANVLDGQSGADTMAGGEGNDTYYVDNAGDVIIEAGLGGADIVVASVDYVMGVGVKAETLTLAGSARNATGSAIANSLNGNIFDNLLNGGAGADTLTGGAGNDTYVVDNTGDVIVEAAGEGTDKVFASATYTLVENVENLVLTGISDINATGNGLANYLVGNAANNQLDGGLGADTLAGGVGNDTYTVDSTDVVIELAGQGTDTINAAFSYVLGEGSFVENLTLTGTGNINATGNSGNNILTDTTGNNVIDGGAGADTMMGGSGHDTYYVDDAGDRITDLYGYNTIYASVSFTLDTPGLGSAVSTTLILTGSAAIDATGNKGNNILNGNDAANLIDGGLGFDTMTGGAGNDTYVVNDAKDVIVEAADGGSDTVMSSIFMILQDNIENLVLTGNKYLRGHGNALDNSISGNTAVNELSGLGGADYLFGDAGNDTLNGDGFNPGGNDTLDGGAGNDILTGDGGADRFVFGAGSGVDSITDFRAVGNDLIDINAYTHGVVGGGGVTFTQSGANTIIDLGGGNTITVVAIQATDPGLLSHIVW